MFDLNKMGFGASSNTWSLESLSLDYSSDVVDFGLESFEYNTGLESLSIATEGIFQTIKDAIVRFFKWIGEKLGLIEKQSLTMNEKTEKVVKQSEEVEKKAEEAKEVVNEVKKSEAVDNSTPVTSEEKVKKEKEKKEQKEKVNTTTPRPDMTEFKTSNPAPESSNDTTDRISNEIQKLLTKTNKKYSDAELLKRLHYLKKLNMDDYKELSTIIFNIKEKAKKVRINMKNFEKSVSESLTHLDMFYGDLISSLKDKNPNNAMKFVADIKNIGFESKLKNMKEYENEFSLDKEFENSSIGKFKESVKVFFNNETSANDKADDLKILSISEAEEIVNECEKDIFLNFTSKTLTNELMLFKSFQERFDETIKNHEVDKFIKDFESIASQSDFEELFSDKEGALDSIKLGIKNSQQILMNILKVQNDLTKYFGILLNVVNTTVVITNDLADLRIAIAAGALSSSKSEGAATESFPGLEDLNYKVDLYKRMVTKGYSVELAMESMAVTHNLVVPNYYEYQIATEGIFESIKNAFRRFFEWLKEKLGFSKSKAEDIKSKTEEVKASMKESKDMSEDVKDFMQQAEKMDITEIFKRIDELTKKHMNRVRENVVNPIKINTKDAAEVFGRMDHLSKIDNKVYDDIGKSLGEMFETEKDRLKRLEHIQFTFEDKYAAWVRHLKKFLEKDIESRLENTDSTFMRFEGNIEDDEKKLEQISKVVDEKIKPIIGITPEKDIKINTHTLEATRFTMNARTNIGLDTKFKVPEVLNLIDRRYEYEEKRNKIINETIKPDELTKLLDDTLKSLESNKEKSKETIELFKKFQTDLMNLIKMHNRLQRDYMVFLKSISTMMKLEIYFTEIEIHFTRYALSNKKNENENGTIEF